jgi:hypothetical protein
MAVAPEEPVQQLPVQAPHVEEPVGEPVKKTYASIVCVTFLILLCIVYGHLVDTYLKQWL